MMQVMNDAVALPEHIGLCLQTSVYCLFYFGSSFFFTLFFFFPYKYVKMQMQKLLIDAPGKDEGLRVHP